MTIIKKQTKKAERQYEKLIQRKRLTIDGFEPCTLHGLNVNVKINLNKLKITIICNSLRERFLIFMKNDRVRRKEERTATTKRLRRISL